jgi:hypothetical protein
MNKKTKIKIFLVLWCLTIILPILTFIGVILIER